jgi:glycosyltransferase involved in cell wall biosynthesis
MKLSLIVPIYNKAAVVIPSLTGILNVLDQLDGLDYEVIAVIDGSPDNSYELAKTIKHRNLRVENLLVNRGKGGAVTYGFSLATGDYIGFMDCGLDINPASLVYYTREFKHGYDALIANRFLRHSVYKSGILRKLYSHGFYMFRTLLFSTPVFETQVGLKVFSKRAISAVLPRIKETGWLLDLEILSLMRKLGLKSIKEVPVVINMSAEGETSESAKLGTIVKIFANMVTLSARIGRLSWIMPWNRLRVYPIALTTPH